MDNCKPSHTFARHFILVSILIGLPFGIEWAKPIPYADREIERNREKMFN